MAFNAICRYVVGIIESLRAKSISDDIMYRKALFKASAFDILKMGVPMKRDVYTGLDSLPAGFTAAATRALGVNPIPTAVPHHQRHESTGNPGPNQAV